MWWERFFSSMNVIYPCASAYKISLQRFSLRYFDAIRWATGTESGCKMNHPPIFPKDSFTGASGRTLSYSKKDRLIQSCSLRVREQLTNCDHDLFIGNLFTK